jgi:hypothetical protein
MLPHLEQSRDTVLQEKVDDVIVAFGTPRAKAAQRATKTIPIVAISIGDPIGSGLVTSLAHPAGNITGNTILGPDIVTKKLQILKDAIPTVARIAYLWNPENSATADILEDLRKAVPLFPRTCAPDAPGRLSSELHQDDQMTSGQRLGRNPPSSEPPGRQAVHRKLRKRHGSSIQLVWTAIGAQIQRRLDFGLQHNSARGAVDGTGPSSANHR